MSKKVALKRVNPACERSLLAAESQRSLVHEATMSAAASESEDEIFDEDGDSDNEEEADEDIAETVDAADAGDQDQEGEEDSEGDEVSIFTSFYLLGLTMSVRTATTHRRRMKTKRTDRLRKGMKGTRMKNSLRASRMLSRRSKQSAGRVRLILHAFDALRLISLLQVPNLQAYHGLFHPLSFEEHYSDLLFSIHALIRSMPYVPHPILLPLMLWRRHSV